MPCFLPAGMVPGQIFRHVCYYRTVEGEPKSKYLLIPAGAPSGDVIYRLLTSRPHGRPRQPPCYQGLPYPSYYLGFLGGSLTADSWLDLQQADDFDGPAFSTGVQGGLIQPIATLPLALLCPALDCVANADDTTRQQERCIRDARAGLSCC